MTFGEEDGMFQVYLRVLLEVIGEERDIGICRTGSPLHSLPHRPLVALNAFAVVPMTGVLFMTEENLISKDSVVCCDLAWPPDLDLALLAM
jgi:hypothetical protein